MAEGGSGGQEKTEEPTPKKLLDTRKEGQVPRSMDLNNTIGLMIAALGMMMLGSTMGYELSNLMHNALVISREDIFDTKHLVPAIMSKIVEAIFIILPFMMLMLVGTFIGPMSMGGWSFSGKALTPKFEKINPFTGLKRVFGMNGLVELGKALLKFTLLGGIAFWTFQSTMPQYLALSQLPILYAIRDGSELVLGQFLIISASLIIVSSIDIPYQLFTHKKKIKMSVQDIREENKQTEGSPEMKGHRRQMQLEISQGRMLQEIPNANVILVNPTHFAVAIQYDEDGETAPTVLAKGADLMAFKIRELADASNIPIFEAPPLARAIYYTTEINGEIPSDLYLAVARVLAYIYQLNNMNLLNRVQPERPNDLPIPDEYTNLTRKQPKWTPKD